MKFLKRIEKLLGVNDNKKKKKKETAKTTPLKRNVVKTSSKTTPLNRTTTTKSTPLKRNTTITRSNPLINQSENKYVKTTTTKSDKNTKVKSTPLNYEKAHKEYVEREKQKKELIKFRNESSKKIQDIQAKRKPLQEKSAKRTIELQSKNSKLMEKPKTTNKDISNNLINDAKNKKPAKSEYEKQRDNYRNVNNDKQLKTLIKEEKKLKRKQDEQQYNKDFAEVYLEDSKNYDKASERVFKRGIAGTTSALENLFKDSYYPGKATIRGGRARENAKSGLEKTAGNVAEGVGGMLPSYAFSAITTPAGGNVLMGLQAGSGSYKEAKTKNKSDKQAVAYGVAIGTLESALGKVLGGISGVYGKGFVSGKLAESIPQKVTSNPAVQKLVAQVVNSGGEFTEEYLQEYLQPIVANLLLDEKNKVKFFSKENLEAGIAGGLTSAVMNTPSYVINNPNINIDTKNDIKNTKNKTNTKVEQTTINNLIEKLNQNKKEINNKIQEAMTLNQNKTLNTTETQRQKINDAIDIRVGEISQLKAQNRYIQNVIENNDNLRNVNKITKTDNLTEYVADAIERNIQQNMLDENSMIENFKEYLEENNIEKPTQKNVNDFLDTIELVYEGYDNDLTTQEIDKAEQKYKEVIENYLNENNISNNIENLTDLEYNNDVIERKFNTIQEAIENDPRKKSFAKYNDNVDFFNLDYNRMKKSIKLGSKYALEAQNLGLNSYSFNDDKYSYDLDIINHDNNTFKITNVEEIENGVRSDVDERIKKQNNGLFTGSAEYDKGLINSNIESTKNRTTSKNDVELSSNEQQKSRINENRQSIESEKTNSTKELDDSSFSNEPITNDEVSKLAKELDKLDPEVMAQAFLEKEGDRLKEVAKENNIELTDKQLKRLYNQHYTKFNVNAMIRSVLEFAENRNYEIDRVSKIVKNNDIKFWGDEINNMQGEIEANLNSVQTDEFGNPIGPALNNIFAKYEKDGRGTIFNDYLFHLSNIERHKNGVGSQVPMEESIQIVKDYEKENPDFLVGKEEANNYTKNLLKRQVNSGIVSQETADNILSKYDFYTPFYEMQYLDENYVPSDTDEVKSGSTLRRARGGADKNLMPFKEAMAIQTQKAISNSYKNELYKQIVNSLPKKAIDIMDNLNPDESNTLLKDGKKHYLTAFENGTPTQVEISQELFNELNKTMENYLKSFEKTFAPVLKPIQKGNVAKRKLVTTWSPTFMATNPLKDVQDGVFNTKYPKDFVKNYNEALKKLVTGKDATGETQRFLNKYGKPNVMGDYSLEGVDTEVSQLFNKNGKINNSKLTKLAKKIPQINEVLELVPRYAEYLASIDNGCSQLEALYNAREVTVNFGRGGYGVKFLNRNGATFLNANIQGLSKFLRNFHDAPLRTTMKATTIGLSRALINELLYGDDEDYELLPDYIKNNYYVFKISSNKELNAIPKDIREKYVIKKGKSTFLRVPSGRMLSVYFSLFLMTKDRVMGRRNDTTLGEDIISWGKNSASQVGVPDIGESNLFAPITQARSNKAWYGGQIVPNRLLKDRNGHDIPAKQQYDASTDKLSIWLGQKTGWSPYKINYILDQYSGGIGDMILPLITEEAQSSSNNALGMALAPLKDKFTADTINDNKNVTNFYSKAEKLGKKSNDVNATGKDKLKSGYMDNVSYQMGALYKQIREVQADKNLSKKEKYERYEVLKSQINELAKNGLENVNKVKGDEYYGEVEEDGKKKQLFRSSGGNYYELYDNQKEALDSANLSVKERNDLYKTKNEISKYMSSTKDNIRYSKRYEIIKNSNNSQSAKAILYNQNKQYYQKDPTPLVKDNLVDSFLDIESQNIKSDYDKNGKIVYNSKKKKIAKAINKLDLSAKDKQKLYDFYYPSKKRSTGSKKGSTKGSKRTTTTKTPKVTRTKVTPVKLSNKSVKLTPVKSKSTSSNKYYQEALKNLLFKKTK